MEDPNSSPDDNPKYRDEPQTNPKRSEFSEEAPNHYQRQSAQPKEKLNRPQSAKHDIPGAFNEQTRPADNSIRIKQGEQASYMASKPLNPVMYNNYNFNRGFYGNTNIMNSKIKTKYILHDKEQLYDESLKLKEANHKLKVENTQLKTKLLQYEKEIDRKDRETEEMLAQFQSNIQNSNNRLAKGRAESHLMNTLKKQVKELRNSEKLKENEINLLKKNTKVTKLQEMDTEMKMYIDECTRLKHLLEDVIQQKSFAGQEDMMMLEQRYNQQANLFKQAKQENQELANAYKMMETDMQKWKGIAVDYEKKGKTNYNKDVQTLKKANETYKKEIDKLKQDMTASNTKPQNKSQLQTKIDQLNSHVNNLTTKLEYICNQTKGK